MLANDPVIINNGEPGIFLGLYGRVAEVLVGGQNEYKTTYIRMVPIDQVKARPSKYGEFDFADLDKEVAYRISQQNCPRCTEALL